MLYTEHSAITDFDSANLVVAPLAGGAPTTVLRGGYYGRYLPTGLTSPTRSERDGGHLIYVEQGTLYAVPFDLGRLETVGQAVPVLDGLASNSATAGAQVAFSPTGTLVYLPGATRSPSQPIDWMTRDGKIAPLLAEPANWADPDSHLTASSSRWRSPTAGEATSSSTTSL